MDVEQHRHCMVCGRAMPVGKELCSKKCNDHYEALLKRRKMLTSLLYALMIFFVMMLLFGIG